MGTPSGTRSDGLLMPRPVAAPIWRRFRRPQTTLPALWRPHRAEGLQARRFGTPGMSAVWQAVYSKQRLSFAVAKLTDPIAVFERYRELSPFRVYSRSRVSRSSPGGIERTIVVEFGSERAMFDGFSPEGYIAKTAVEKLPSATTTAHPSVRAAQAGGTSSGASAVNRVR